MEDGTHMPSYIALTYEKAAAFGMVYDRNAYSQMNILDVA
jgi:hypothetical protein